MNTGKISARYAKALYKFAEEGKHETDVYEAMKLVSSSFSTVPQLREALINPTISQQKKVDLLITAAGTNVCPEFKRFVDMVIENRREEYFQSISLVYQDFYRKEKNIVISQLVTASPVSDAEIARMRKAVEAVSTGSVEFETSVNPDLIGGFVLNVETYQLDASIKGQLRSIRDSLLNDNAKDA